MEKIRIFESVGPAALQRDFAFSEHHNADCGHRPLPFTMFISLAALKAGRPYLGCKVTDFTARLRTDSTTMAT
jgi:hypothetical protein